MRPFARQTLSTLLLCCAAATGGEACPGQEASAVRRAFAAQPVWVIGERHRTAEGHRLFEALVTQALEAGEKVLVGLEIPADRQSAVDAAMRGHAIAAAPAVIDSPSYRALLQRLGQLGEVYTGCLTVRAIDTPQDNTRDRDRHMAETLHRLQVGGGQRVLALVGNLHALKAPLGLEGRGGLRLAARLEAAGLGVATLLQLRSGDALPPAPELLLEPTTAPASAALQALCSLVQDHPSGPSQWRSQAADAVLLRP